ncbi:MAG TPA: hypothetical protein VIL36_08085 [Acidimicrobiales bacterium]
MTDPTDPTDRSDAPGGPPPEVVERLEAFLEEQGMLRPESYEGWAISDAGGGSWVMTPPGMSGVLFAITPDVIRPILPARENVQQALAELGIS